jgi:hypothetical protein
MFLQKAALQRSSVELAVSYMEIYKDEVYDLFVNRESVRCLSVEIYARTLGYATFIRSRDVVTQNSLQAPKLPVRENDAGQVFVANLSSLPIESVEEFDAIYEFVLCTTPSPTNINTLSIDVLLAIARSGLRTSIERLHVRMRYLPSR